MLTFHPSLSISLARADPTYPKPKINILDFCAEISSLIILSSVQMLSVLKVDWWRTLNKLKKTFDVGLALSNVANSADDVVQGSKNLKEGTLKTILENLKGSLTAYNSIQGVKTLKDLNATSIDKTKALFGETQDAPEAFERIKKDIEILQKRLEDSKNKDSKKQN